MVLNKLSTVRDFTAIDFETANAHASSICQVGLIRVEGGTIVKELELLVKPPGNQYHWGNSRVHGIGKKDTENAPDFKDVWPLMEPYVTQQHVVAHNAPFDTNCLKETLKFYALPVPFFTKHCTVSIYKRNLALLCSTFGIELQHHNALSDARACALLYSMYLDGKSKEMLELLRKQARPVSPNP